MTPDLEAAVAAVYAARDRDDMAPTIAAFAALSAAHPDEAVLVHEHAGAYDTAGEEALAAPLYEQALEMGLEGEARRRCLVQYGSTLRNLERFDDSLAVLDGAAAEFPDSVSVAVFRALTLQKAGRSDAAVGALVGVLADALPGDLSEYPAAVRGNGEFLVERDRRS
ncbi:tetratricopeptide repeat protein [uncultured Amnibacterium sp.]|uniref:tetratricopeptide repeat protein n=1 Tax=uncultured Amnibacterium sp. TaxID=1631851 RepID=UPI0035CBE322